MKLKGDTVTSSIGIVGALLFMQQTYLPDLLPEEVVIPIVASLLSGYGIATNKNEIEIPFTEGTVKKKRICELEAELEALRKELEELESIKFMEPNSEDNDVNS